jgi:hypothetical protein
VAVHPNSLKNLRKRSKEELAEIGRLGGIKSGEARRKRSNYSLIVQVINDGYTSMGLFKVVGYNHAECEEIWEKACRVATDVMCDYLRKELDKKMIPYLRKKKKEQRTKQHPKEKD